MDPLISIIIPCKDIDQQTCECIDKCKELDYNNFEIIVLPDYEHPILPNVKIVATGEVSPGKKRNIGEKNSTGEFLGFIDSDAYPQKEWLKNAIRYFNDPETAAVGGPGITPVEDPILEKAGGYVLSSFMMGGLSNRFRQGKSIVSKDIHSCNFIAHRSIIEKIGGWNEKYWPGEDTLICLNIDKTGKKMLESADVVVYHHRRPLFTKHIKQVSRFGMHRGFFAKRFPETSLRFNYFIPSILVVFMLFGSVFSFFEKSFVPYIIYISGIYMLAVLLASVLAYADGKNLRLIPLVFSGTIVTHCIYGSYFIAGLLSSELER